MIVQVAISWTILLLNVYLAMIIYQINVLNAKTLLQILINQNVQNAFNHI